MDNAELAGMGREAYFAVSGGPLMGYGAIAEKTRQAWLAAAAAIRERVEREQLTALADIRAALGCGGKLMLSELAGEVSRVIGRVSGLEEKVSSLESTNQWLQGRAEAAEATITALTRERDEAREERDIWRRHYDKVYANLVASRGDVDRLRGEIGRCTDKLEELAERNHRLQSFLTAAQEEAKRAKEESEVLRSHLEDECGDCLEKRQAHHRGVEEGTSRGRGEGVADFICYLIDHCEGYVNVTEEWLQQTYADYLKSGYASPPPEQGQEVCVGGGMVECPNCAGEGVTSMGVCSICNGEGKGFPEDFPEVEP